MITDLNQQVVLMGSTGVDVFPSLHCAISCYILFFDFAHRRWRFFVFVVPCVGLWISTIYLRYHYFIDVIVGFGLSVACLWMVSRFDKKEKTHVPAARI